MTTKHLFALFLTMVLAACGGGGSDGGNEDPPPRESDPNPTDDPVTPSDPTPPTDTGAGGSQIRLGLVTGANVTFYVYGDLSQPVLTTTSTTLEELEMSVGPSAFDSLSDEEKLQQAGKIDLRGFEFEPDTWYLAVTEGGEDVDVDGNRQIDAAGTPVKGQVHGVLQGRHINSGQYNLSLLTELAYQSIEAKRAQTGTATASAQASKIPLAAVDIQGLANQVATTLADGLADAQVGYTELIGWWPGWENLKPAVQDALLEKITYLLRTGDDMGLVIQQALRETSTHRYNPYWYTTANSTPEPIIGTWILVGQQTISAQTAAGPVIQNFLTRHTMRVAHEDMTKAYQFQMCSMIYDWTAIRSLFLTSSTDFQVGHYHFKQKAFGRYEVTFQLEADGFQISGNFLAIRRSELPDYSFGGVSIVASTIDDEYDGDDPALMQPPMFAGETFPVKCFAEQVSADPAPSKFNILNPYADDQHLFNSIASHQLKVGFGDHHMNVYSEIVPGGTEEKANEGHFATIIKGSWSGDNVASRDMFSAFGGANLATMSGLYEDTVRLQSQFDFKTVDPQTSVAPPEAMGTLLLDP